MGLPMVCTDIPIFHSIVLDKSNMLFFPSRNDKVLAQQIEKLIVSSDLRYEYAQKSLHISKQFSIDSMVMKHENIYKKIRLLAGINKT